MKKLYDNLLLVFIFFFFSACSQEEDSFQFLSGPQTVVGQTLLKKTSEIDKFMKDTTFVVKDGLQITEIAYMSRRGEPVRLFIFDVDLTKDLWIEASMPNNDTIFGTQVLSRQALFKEGKNSHVLGGVNGDFFQLDNGIPSGIYVSQGRVLKDSTSGSSRTFFAIDKKGNALIAENHQYKDLEPTLKEVVGGSVRLLRAGKMVAEPSIHDPRTAVGISKNQQRVFFLVVDGRNWGYSSGMDFTSLASILSGLGAVEAINLDGGGSSTFFVRNTNKSVHPLFSVRNFPSDSLGEERPVANGLMILTDKI